MSRSKTILITASIVIIIIAVGAVIFISKQEKGTPQQGESSNIPEITGTTGTDVPQVGGTQAEVPKPVEISTAKAGDCLLLEQIYCNLGGPAIGKDGKVLTGSIFNLPVGTKLFAPFDGSVGNHYLKTKGGVNYRVIAVVDISPWDVEKSDKLPAHRIDFIAGDFVFADGLKFGSSIEKGQLIGEFRSAKPVVSEMIDGVGNVLIKTSDNWNSIIPSVTANDSGSYLKSIFGTIK
ncbi:MAG: hypothetical protein PHG66_02355 [Candidatus Colwellbacteria bacterium]|nr:hypothetical protein [Candidatus Colwellbacteria bacterium]